MVKHDAVDRMMQQHKPIPPSLAHHKTHVRQNWTIVLADTIKPQQHLMGQAQYDRWQEKYFQAKTALAGRDEKLAAVGDLIERDLLLLGCTAIEDKLQAGVPEAIERLANAGIRIWVLTGDKQVPQMFVCI